MRLLYIVLTPRGLGEVVVALGHAAQLTKAGAAVDFVVGPAAEGMLKESGHSYRVIDPSAGAAARTIIEDAVLEFRPTTILLADYFTYWVIAEGQYGIDPWFVEKYDVPVLPIDMWEWDQTNFMLDITDGLERPVSRHILEMPTHLRPVPLAHPEPSGRGRPYQLMTGDDRVSAARRREVFESLSLRDGDRFILIPVSAWQQPEDRKAHDGVVNLARHVPGLVAHYLRQLPPSATFVFVGTPPPALAELPAAQTRILPPCPADRFSALIGSADAVLSLNPAALTLMRATLADVAGMVLTNSFPARTADEVARLEDAVGGLMPPIRSWLAETGGVGAFRMWPMSFTTLMAPMLAGNPYLDAVPNVELLDERAVVGGLHDLLYDESTRERFRAARAVYRDKVRAVPDAVTALRAALG